MEVLKAPTVITFPKMAQTVVQISCGQAHALAVTREYKMYSWGNATYGALGFGNTTVNVTFPSHLEII